MPNDARLGLAVGLGVVIVVAVIFYQREHGATKDGSPAANAAPVGRAVPRRSPRSQVAARVTSHTKHPAAADRTHLVRDGDTLFALAEHYYGDGEQFAELFRANRKVLKTPDRLEPGTVLVIPELEVAEDAAETP